MTSAKTSRTIGLMPPPAGEIPAAPGPQAPQLMTVALLCAADGKCQCDACLALRRLAATMREEVLNA